MKRFVSFILAFIMIIGTVANAASGDIIHMGNKKIYEANSDELIQAIIDGADIREFYREILSKDGTTKFVNIVEEEERELEILREVIEREAIDSPEDLAEYLKNSQDTKDKIQNIANSIGKAFETISNNVSFDEYFGSPQVNGLTTPGNYSIPEAGSKNGTTMIRNLNFPSGSSQWIYKILDEKEKAPALNTVITGEKYGERQDIVIEAGKYIALYATDRSNKVKASVSILVDRKMIRRSATLIEGGKVNEGKSSAYAISLSDLDLAEGKWKYFIRNEALKDIFRNDSFDDAKEYQVNNDIVVADENTTIDEGFKRFVYLIDVKDGEDKNSYYRFEVNKDIISLPASLLDKDNYEGPIMGDDYGTTRFTKLNPNSTGISSWAYKLSDDVNLPIKGSEVDKSFKPYTVLENINAKVGEKLILVGLTKDKLSHYSIFDLKEENIKGDEAKLEIKASKGQNPGTTMVNPITLPTGASKWMYHISKDTPEIYLGKVYSKSKEYIIGDDITAEADDILFLFATDKDNNILAYGKKKLDANLIKAGLAYNMALDKGAYLKDPSKGSKVGTIKFDFLKYENHKFKFTTSKSPIPIPEKDGDVDSSWKDIETVDIATKDIQVFKDDADELRADEGFNYNMMIVAIDNKDKVQAYYSFDLNKDNVRLPVADKLNQDVANYSNPIKGTYQKSTKIESLDIASLKKASKFRYKIIDSNKMIIEYNTIIPLTTDLKANRDIYGELGKNLLILATDNDGRTKYYDIIPLTSDNLRFSNAPPLIKNTHFTEPVPGESDNSTRVTYLKLPDKAPAGDDEWVWMYKVSDVENNSIEADVKLDGSYELTLNTDISAKKDQYLIILATDNKGNVKYQYNHRLVDANIRGGKSGILSEDLNYSIDKGSKAGTTRFTLLDAIGLTDYNNTQWRYKFVESIPNNDKDKPYLGSIVTQLSNPYIIDTDIKVTPYSEKEYGYLLLLATDLNGKTKAYKYIKLSSDNVKEHAPIIDASLSKGSDIDTTRISLAAPSEKTYKYIISPNEFDTPSIGDYLPINFKDYTLGKDIQVKFGQYLTIFELDKDDHIAGFKSFEINLDNEIVKQDIINFSLLDDSTPEGENILLEGEINNGNKQLLISLTDSYWVDGIDRDPDLREKLYKGLISNNQDEEWSKVVNSLIKDGFGNIEIHGKDLNISLVKTPGFDILEEQKIRMIVDPDLINDAINPTLSKGELVIKPTIRANISGQVVNELVRANDLKLGGKTIVIDLVDGSWKNTINESILKNGLSNDKSPNWNNILENLSAGNIVRESSTRLTITLPAYKDFKWDGTKSETITVNIDSELLIDASEKVVANPTFTLYPDILQVNGKATFENEPTNEVLFKAPDGKEVHSDSNKWRISVDVGTLKDDLSSKDLLITGLPKGLVATATKTKDENTIDIVISGTSTNKITDSTVFVSIKGSAVTEPNSMASNAIELKLKLANEMKFDNVKWRIEKNNLNFNGITTDMQYKYSNNPDGQWLDVVNNDTIVTLPLEPMTVTLREKAQPKVIKEFTFTNEDAPLGVSVNSYKYDDIKDEITVTLIGHDDKMEYSKNAGDSYDAIPGSISLNSTSDLRVRYKVVETGNGNEDPIEKGKLPSKATDRLNGQYLGNVVLAAGQGKILNTESTMEYSLKSVKDQDGIWVPARAKETLISFSKGDTVWIRDSRDILNFRKLDTISQAKEPDLSKVYFDISIGKINNLSNQDLEYRIAEGPWSTLWKNSPVTGVVFKAGALEFRIKANGNTLASQAGKKEPTIKAMKSMPIIEFNDVENVILSINGLNRDKDWDNFQYRVNPSAATPWNDGNRLKEENLNGDKIVEIRIKATTHALPSEANKSVKFTRNLDMSHVALSDYTNPPLLNGTTTNMSYKIIYFNEEEIGWNKCLNGNTPLPGVSNINDVAQIILHDNRLGQEDNTEIVFNNANSAPKGVKIKEYKYAADGSLKVVLEGVNNTMEYRTSDDLDWISIIEDGVTIDITSYSDELRVRVKSNSDNLPSAPTPRLNGVYLGDVSLKNASLINTNASMEYNLNGASDWTGALDNETPLEIKSGDFIKIRQLDNDMNHRDIGTITVADKPDSNRLKEIGYSIKDSKITGAKGLDYRINEGPWIAISEDSESGVNFTAGRLEFRTSNNGFDLESGAVLKAIIAEATLGPDVRIVNKDNKIIEYYDNNIWKEIDGSFQYKVASNGNWISANDFKNDDTKNGNVVIFVRKLATNYTLASKERSANDSFSDVRINVASGLIENTKTSMEYSIDSSNGIDGFWIPASKNNTNIEFVENMNIWIRELDNPTNSIQILSNLQRESIDSEASELDFNIINETITNNSDSKLKFRIKKGPWQNLDDKKPIRINFTEGSLEFKKVSTASKLESFIVEKFVILAAASPPLVSYDDVANRITHIDGSKYDSTTSSDNWKHYQYRINKLGDWKQGELLLTDLDLSGDKSVEIRRKAEKDTLPSQSFTATFKTNLELSHVKLSSHAKPLELNGTTSQMDYRVWIEDSRKIPWVFNGGNGDNGWTKSTDKNTVLHRSLSLTGDTYIFKIEIRDSKQPENTFMVNIKN